MTTSRRSSSPTSRSSPASAELGAQLAADYADREPVLVSVLKGSIIFLADLVRAMPVHCRST